MACPLYKRLKTNGTTFYAFPSSAEDISAAYQNQNYKMYFSKYVLLNLPKYNVSGTASINWDFDNTAGLGYGFQQSVYSSLNSPANDYKDKMIESLRNYVANQEVTIKESILNNTEYYYDNNVLSTTSEKIFFKWCKKLGLIDFEQANPGDEYFDNLTEFERNNLNDDNYFPEILWKEREVIEWSVTNFYENDIDPVYGTTLKLDLDVTTNFRVGDYIELNGITNPSILSLNGLRGRVLYIVAATSTEGQKIVTSIDYSAFTGNTYTETTGYIKLVYNRLVQYIGEVNGINNVAEANRSYTEVYAHIPDHTGATPDILFRTSFDDNYKPNMTFPILPSQYQPEIMGAEVFTNPIVSDPTSYPGNYYGQFDTLDFTYETSGGDSLRRSGDYFGVSGDINVPIVLTNDVNGQSSVDGVSIDFDPAHYVKMNIIGRELTNFDQFNALEVNNQPPSDFEFNAILWYYTVEDINGNKTNNLYGISFVDNPQNNVVSGEYGLRVPTFKKLATSDSQDGTSYAFSLNLSFNIINENPQDTYNPEAINSLFSMNLYNQAMQRLSSVNQSFMNIISNQTKVEEDIMDMKQLLYSQTDFQTINKKIANLENLLKLYSTMQIVDSDTITVETNNSTNPPRLSLNSVDSTYYKVYDIATSELYNVSGIIPYSVTVPQNKNFLVYVQNNDTTNYTLPYNDKLTIVLDRDLDFKQSFDIIVDANDTATQNKQLEIYLKFRLGSSTNLPVETKLLETIDLPIYYNSVTQLSNTSKRWSGVNFNIDLSKNFQLNTGSILEVPINSNANLVYNSFQKGDTYEIKDFIIGTTSQINFSGQYVIDSVGLTNSYVYFNVSNNVDLVNYGASYSLPLTFNGTNYLLSNNPYLKLNKGIKYKITRISESDNTSITDRYLIEKEIH